MLAAPESSHKAAPSVPASMANFNAHVPDLTQYSLQLISNVYVPELLRDWRCGLHAYGRPWLWTQDQDADLIVYAAQHMLCTGGAIVLNMSFRN